MRTRLYFGWGGGGGGGGGELASEVPFIILMFCFVYTCIVFVLSTAYLSCIGLFCMYVLANSRQLFILFSYDKLVLTLLVILKAL